MSAVIIQDGRGTGNKAGVNPQGKLVTIAVTESIGAHHSFEGEGYSINTGTISLTNANKSAIQYLKNNEDEPLIVNVICYFLGTSTGGAGDVLVQVERNPTGGTIVSGASTITPINRDFSTARTLTADSYKGAEDQTLTGGTVIDQGLFSSVGAKIMETQSYVLRKGNSIGVTITPQPSNTAMNVQCAMSLYRSTEEVDS